MSTASFTVKLFLRVEKLRKDGTAAIYVRVGLNKEKMELSTNKFVLPASWNTSTEKVVKNPEAKAINQYLDSFKSKITNAYSQLFIANKDITLNAIRALALGEKAERKYHLIEVAEEHNRQFKSLLGIKYSPGSYKNYKTTLKYLIEFVPTYTGRKDIPLEYVNYKFCEAYFSFLTSTKSCNINGANKQLQRVKKIINYAIRLGYILNNPMATYSLEFEASEKVALTIDEVNKLMNLQLNRPTLQEVRDVFLLQCFTGLSYSDVKRLSVKDIAKGEDGSYWIKMKRQKTNVLFSIPLLRPAIAILDSYLPPKLPEAPVMPVLSNQKMNDNLKVIQELAGITKNLTTHLARHTFATTITLSNGVPIETVSRMLGHTKLSTTQVYAKVLGSKIADDMKGIVEKFRKE